MSKGAPIKVTMQDQYNAEADQEVDVLPMSFAQQRLWFLDQFEPNSPFYNIPSAVRLQGNLDFDALTRAINEIINRHETLRTTFETVDNEPSQIIHPFAERSFSMIDLTADAEAKREAKVRRMAAREAATPFDLKIGPLLRVTFVKLADNDWVLLLTMHHIISDGWSVGVFVREIAALYDAFSHGRPSPLPPLQIQYGDFSIWQQEHIAGAVLEKQVEYWKSKLSGSLPVLEIPGDFPRPAVQTMVGANEDMLVAKKIIEPFKDLVRRDGATFFMGLLAAFKILLHRYTNLDDILVGSPIANRNRAEIEPLIGFFVNTLVLRSDLSGDPSFKELLSRVKKTTLESYDNQDVPFERLVELLQPNRDMAHSPLFQVMFILQNNPMGGGANGDIEMSTLNVDAGTSTFDLTLMATEQADGVQLSAEFNTDIYLPGTMRRLLGHFENLLAEISASPEAPISRLRFLPEDERRRLQLDWNDYDRDYALDKTVHSAFQDQVQKTPDNDAVVIDDDRLTYAQLNLRANKLAHYLRTLGVGPDVKVIICMDKHIDLPVAVLGVLKAGGAYVPVDPTYPTDRIDYMLEDSNAAVVLSHSEFRNVVEAEGRTVVLVDADWGEIDQQSGEDPAELCDADNLAYMIYTSGSTGKAKGTMVAHKSILNAYYAWEEDYHLRDDGVDSHLQMASFSFDVFGGDFVRALLSGGKLVLAQRQLLLEAEKLYQLMLREKVNCAEFVPAVLRNLMQYVEEKSLSLSFMRNLIAGSDVWYVNEYKRFLAACGPNTRLINSFGLTEAAVDSTFFEGDVQDYADERLVPIGRPFANSKIYIVDQNLNLAPIGVPGELLAAGPNLARGYFKRPDLTAEKFIPNPFCKEGGERLYRTGDLARRLADGNIEFLGRIDHQIKIRGFRIEMGEIETVLEKLPSIGQAVVVAREDQPGDKRLVGYVTNTNGRPLDVAAVRAFLKDNIPDYMIPSAIMTLDTLPLTPNGKVDRKALPAPDQSAFTALQKYAPAKTETEKKLVSIWKDVLGLQKIGVEDNFFELGGHSLLATQVLSRIKVLFKVDLPLRSLFEFVTIRELASAVHNAVSSHAAAAPAMTTLPPEEQPVLSFAQERLWFLDQLEPDSPFYNISDAVRVKGELDVDRLLLCLEEIVRRHDVLRSTFDKKDGKPVITIHPNVDIEYSVHDLMKTAKEERRKKSEEIIRREATQPFRLSEAPLFRICLIKMTADEHIFVLTIHHIISDGWSSNIMFYEVGALYESYTLGMESPLPALPLQYQDFAWWQRQWLQGERLEQEIDYWRRTLEGSPPVINLPTDRPRPAVQSANGDYKTFKLSPELSSALDGVTQAHGATPFMTLLAAFQALLYRYSGQDDVNVGTPIANRVRGELESLIGFFVNTLVLRADLSGSPTFAELLQRVKETALGAFAHQDVPFEKIVDALKVERDLSHSPLFQVMFALQNIPGQAGGGESELQIEPLDAHSGAAKFDITLFMVEEEGHYSGALEYNTDLFDSLTIDRMIQHFIKLLKEVVQNPDLSIDALPLVLPQEKQAVLFDWNGSPASLDVPENVVALFEHTVHSAENLTAVRCQDAKLTYAELNRRVNCLANYLIERGVRTDDLVGLCIDRSPEMIIAMLAILKAGGAYVPIDPSYPGDRIAYMLEDSNVSILLSSQRVIKKLPRHNAVVVLVDVDWPAIKASSDANPGVTFDPDQLAYMIYTSGSTGKPKGTMITHSGLIHYLDWCYKTYPLEKGRGSIVHSTIAFDATVTAVFTPLLTGKSITLVADDAGLEGLAEALQADKDFSVVKITPAHLELLGHQASPQSAAELTHSFIIGGENLTADQIRFWQHNAPDTLLYNEYGPTETVVGCVVYEAHQWRGVGSVPIGRAISNAFVYVLDEQLNPLPPGVPGELYVGGAGVARGYLHRPDLTAERFVPDPFSGSPGARLYKTGDLVRYLNDGRLIYLGRLDNQVKIRGYRIELGEIDALLLEHPEVSAALTIARQDAPGEKRIVSYVVPQNDKTPSVDDLYARITRELPDYMTPAAIVALEEFPLTPNGKVDRRALPLPDYAALQSQAEFVAPRNDEEKMLADVFREILRIDQVGVYDNFFELGGHSLLATQLTSRIRDVFHIELPLRDLFESPTIAALVHKMKQAKRRSQGAAAPPLTSYPRDGELPLSFAQQRLWFLDQLAPNNPNYNIPAALRLNGRLDIPALEKALAEIVRRHEALRTVFEDHHGTPHQFILPDPDVSVVRIDLRELDADARGRELMRLVTEDAMTPFRLDIGPLFRSSLILLGEDEYVFTFTVHHIISDGWSTGVFLNEVGVLYEAFHRNTASPLPPLKIQYADYAIWQRGWLKGEVLAEQINFWKQQIGVNPPVLDLPTDHPRPAMQSANGDAVAAQISAETSRALLALSQKHDVTLFMTLISAFQVLLHRYTHQREILIGSPIANRTFSETEALIGFFVNTLVLKADFDRAETFPELLQQVREFTLDAYAHQDVPFEQLVDELEPDRDMSRSPIFQAMFVLQNTPRGANGVQLPSLRMEVIEPDVRAAKYDLTVVMAEAPDGMFVEFEYNSDLFEKETMQRMLSHFQQVLAGLAADPAQPIASIPLMAESEKQLVTRTWNQTEIQLPDLCIHQLFEKRVALTPDAVAVVTGDEQLTFAELNQRANQLAHALRRHGVGPERIVGISVEKSVDMVVGLLGVLKAGGVYAPIDPAYPPERIDYILKDAGIQILLTQSRLAPRFADYDLKLLALDSDMQDGPALDVDNPKNLTTADNLAYIIYTSGSTGKPKGAMLQHRGLVNLTHEQIKDFRLDESCRCLQFASFSFDASVSEIFTTLVSGAQLYLAAKEKIMPGADLTSYLRSNRITTITLPPSVLSLCSPEGLGDLRTVISAGEACSKDIAEKWSRNRRFLNAYGPTENTVCASSYHVAALPGGAVMPIGRPIGNVRLYVVDEHMQPSPIGVSGELCIAGVQLARGYLNRPDLTAEKFIPNPFSDVPGDRLYRTGDLARCLANGAVEFLGRIDHQVKLRGFRIEPGEIEHALLADSAVKEAVVLVRDLQGRKGDQRLVAYVVFKKGAAATDEELKKTVQAQLPDYMTPQIFIQLPEIPVTPNGKVDRRALPAPRSDDFKTDVDFIAPRNDLEKVLAHAWSAVLGIDEIGVMHNFFELGGHSLLATQLISRLRDDLKSDLPIALIFEAPTIAQMAEKLRRGSQRRSAEPLISPVSRNDELPLSFSQQRLWFLDQLDPGNTAFNLTEAVELKGNLDVSALEATLNDLVQRHEVLRTTFHKNEKGMPVQVIAGESSFALQRIDLTDIPESSRDQEVKKRVAAEMQRPFDLQNGPLLRAELLELDDDFYVIVLTMHHIVSDAWSMGIFIREVAALYASYAANQPALLPEMTLQYADFAAWQRSWLKGEVLEREIDYWRQQLDAGSTVLELPTDRPRPPIKTFHGDRLYFDIDPDVWQRLDTLIQSEGVTPFMLTQAVFAVLLHRYSGQDDIYIGSPIANRNRLQVEQMIGFFVNTLVFRNDLSGSPRFREFLTRVRKTALDAYSHQDVPFEKLVETMHPDRDLSRTPLFQAMLVFQNTPVGDFSLPAVQMKPVDIQNDIVQYDLVMSLQQAGESLSGVLQYNTDLFDKQTIQRWVKHFESLLAGFAAQPDASVDVLPMLSDAEIDTIVHQWNKTQAEFPRHLCAHQVFAQQALKTPDAPAVKSKNGRLTYRQLNVLTNRLGHYLQKRGVRPEKMVGICMERSSEMVAAVLGVMKAGGGYVPLDPAYPDDRLAYMVEDAGIDTILTMSALKATAPKVERLICFDEIVDALKDESDDNVDSGVHPDNLAYMIYTSGSTGRPKGVMLRHRGISNLANAQIADFKVKPESVVLQFASFSFDASVSEIFMALHSGACLYLAHRELLLSPSKLSALIRDEKITVATFPPSLLSVLSPEDVAPLETIVSAGEACSKELALQYAKNRHFVNAYGPTESTVGVCSFWANADNIEAPSLPIGRPYNNIQLYVVDKNLNPVPIGVAGELCIGGIGLARGYHHQPGLTAEKFTPNPFSDRPGERMYHTGDLATFLTNGDIQFLGRIDDQVKIRGFRIELGEIEEVLAACPGIADAVVVARTTGGAAAPNHIAAYLVLGQGHSVTTDDVRNFAARRLPEYMAPNSFTVLEEFPLTPNGKVDKKALPAPDEMTNLKTRERIRPADDLEADLAAMLQELLNISDIGVTDNFFELGGHSLMAIQLLAKIQKKYEQDIPLVQLFREPTVRALAEALRGQTTGATLDPCLVQFHDDGEKPPIFLIHPSGGSVHWYGDLAKALDPAQPVFGIQAKGVSGDAELDSTIAEMATRYIAAIKSRQAHGPYFIASWSMGVAIAFETAQQLRAQGETVGMLAALDQGPVMPNDIPEDETDFVIDMFMGRLKVNKRKLRKMEYSEQLRVVLQQAQRVGLLPQDFTLKTFQHYVKILKIQMDAWRNYAAESYSGDLLLIKGEERDASHDASPDLGWAQCVAGAVDIKVVPGNHNTMLWEENVAAIARIFEQVVAEKT